MAQGESIMTRPYPPQPPPPSFPVLCEATARRKAGFGEGGWAGGEGGGVLPLTDMSYGVDHEGRVAHTSLEFLVENQQRRKTLN